MSKITRSARGELVDFDLLSIKQQLATTPTHVNVDARRRFIDEKNGVKSKTDFITTPPLLTPEEIKKLIKQPATEVQAPTEEVSTKAEVSESKPKQK